MRTQFVYSVGRWCVLLLLAATMVARMEATIQRIVVFLSCLSPACRHHGHLDGEFQRHCRR